MFCSSLPADPEARRKCVNFVQVNKNVPAPYQELDSKLGHQFPLKKRLSFMSKTGKWRYKFLPFGVKIVQETEVAQELLFLYLPAYIDNLVTRGRAGPG